MAGQRNTKWWQLLAGMPLACGRLERALIFRWLLRRVGRGWSRALFSILGVAGAGAYAGVAVSPAKMLDGQRA